MPNTEPILDGRGVVMFHCSTCGGPITKEDFFEQSLRLPDFDESRDDYCDAELIDEFRHNACIAAAARAG
jgi:hypothetical protein